MTSSSRSFASGGGVVGEGAGVGVSAGADVGVGVGHPVSAVTARLRTTRILRMRKVFIVNFLLLRDE